MLKKVILRLFCVAALMSFALPVYAGIAPNAVTIPNNNLAGTGTTIDPFQITNCLDLASLGQDRYQSADQSPKSFILTSDIDCSDTVNWNDGQGFIPLPSTVLYTPWNGQGNPPEQYFEGNGKIISGLYTSISTPQNVDSAQLFQFVGPGASVKNLTITGSDFTEASTSSFNHAILTAVNYGSIQNTQVSGTMHVSGSAAGMLAGLNSGEVTKSSASGNIYVVNSTNGSFGGLTGKSTSLPPGLGNTPHQITDSFSNTYITSTSASLNISCGGIMGSSARVATTDLPFLIKNTFASGRIWCDASNGATSGGLAGKFNFAHFTMQDSFSTAWVKVDNANGAAVVGSNTQNLTFANTYYDGVTSSLTKCSPAPNENACQIKNVNNTEPGYFINNHSNAPLNSWDFDTLWYTTSQYPRFISGIRTPTTVNSLQGSGGTNTIDLTWERPTYPLTGTITDYLISYRQVGSSTWISYEDGVSSNTFATISNLNSATDYEVQIRAINTAGFGQYSAPISVSTIAAAGTTEISYRGDGSADNPLQISSCLQLQDINLPQYDYDLNSPINYILTNDIDCSDSKNWNAGKGFAKISYKAFSSEDTFHQPAIHPQFFDGRNHTISNLTLRDGFLFESVGTLTTIKNMKFVNTEIKSSSIPFFRVGGLISRSKGLVENVQVDVHYDNAKVDATSIGGIVAFNEGSISRSSSSGGITMIEGTNSNIGGLVGLSNGGTIDNSYSTFTISEQGSTIKSNCGGLVGKMTNSSIDHSYTYSSVFCARELSSSGGLVGDADASNSPGISNSFVKGYVGYQSGANHGAIVGKAPGTALYPNTFYDSQSTTQPNCTNARPSACTAKNLFWQDIYYFNNNTTNAPYDTWNFVDTWKTTTYFPVINDAALSPDRPSNLIGITSLTTADLSWEAPLQDGGSPITDYIVQYKKSSDNFWTIFNDGVSTSTSTTVTGLDQGALYNYRVRAVNAAGNGIYSFARTELQLQPKIQSPFAVEFEHGQTIDYSISLVNTTSQPIDSINTTFLSNSFDIDSITPAIGVEGGAPTDIGEVTNGQIWNGLLEPDQELVFEVHGTVSALPNEVGKLSFAGASISYQGTPLDLGEDSDGTIHAESTSFIVKETATNFDIKTSLRETGMIDDGDTVHLKYSIKNNGPKAGFFTDSSVYIFIPPSISVSEIENDYLVCSNIVLIGDNLTSGIYADLQGHVFTQCVGTGGKIANVYETITINITGTATRDLNAGDVLSRAMFIAAQDADTIALNNALASSPSNADSVFESENDNVSKFVYDFVRPQSQATTTTTLPGSSTPNTPSSKDSITTNKSGSSKNTVTVKNGINDSTSSSTSKVSTGEDTSAYESLPELQTFLNETDNAVKASVKKSAMAKFKSGHDSPFEMYWLAGGLMASFIAIGARQAIIVRKATKKLKS